MSRLNEIIKLVVLVGDAVFLALALLAGIISGLVTSGNIVALDFPEARRIAVIILMVTVLIIFCIVYGCCGVVNQIVRKGCFCRGRRVLCCHQFMLLTVLIISIMQQEQLANREKSIKLVIDNVAAYPTYDSFERKLDRYFSKAYFEGNCALEDQDTYDKSSKWLMEWVDQSCPVTMRRKVCALSKQKKEICDTSCQEPIWSKEACCPDEELVCIYRYCTRPHK